MYWKLGDISFETAIWLTELFVKSLAKLLFSFFESFLVISGELMDVLNSKVGV